MLPAMSRSREGQRLRTSTSGPSGPARTDRVCGMTARHAVIAFPAEIHGRASAHDRRPDESLASILPDAQKLPARLAGIRDEFIAVRRGVPRSERAFLGADVAPVGIDIAARIQQAHRVPLRKPQLHDTPGWRNGSRGSEASHTVASDRTTVVKMANQLAMRIMSTSPLPGVVLPTDEEGGWGCHGALPAGRLARLVSGPTRVRRSAMLQEGVPAAGSPCGGAPGDAAARDCSCEPARTCHG